MAEIATTQPQQVSLYTFVTNTPAPVVRLLVELSPVIWYIRRLAEIISWTSGSRSESWLAVALWWAVCLTADFGVRYLLPSIFLVPIVYRYLEPRIPFLRRSASGPTPTTETAISQTLADIQAIQALIPKPPPIPQLPPRKNIVRIVSIIHVPYVAFVHLTSLRVLVALVGTCILTWRAPWAKVSRSVLARSGWVQWMMQTAWVNLSGLPASGAFSSFQQPSTAKEGKAAKGDILYELPEPAHLRFQFAIYENQRWWMGLDFTAALVPGERPSWCAPPPAMGPLPPPGSLALPGPTTVYLPLPSGSSSITNLRMKRTSKWRWEDTEWGVVVRTAAGDGSLHEERLKLEPPADTDAHVGGNAARLVDAVGKGLRRAQNVSDGSPTRDSGLFHHAPNEKDGHPNGGESSKGKAMPTDTENTDSEGWVYADNKWEGGTGLRGRGKYTRYRKWTRVAILEETIEVVPGDVVPTAAAPASPLRPEAASVDTDSVGPLTSPVGRPLTSPRRRVTTDTVLHR